MEITALTWGETCHRWHSLLNGVNTLEDRRKSGTIPPSVPLSNFGPEGSISTNAELAKCKQSLSEAIQIHI